MAKGRSPLVGAAALWLVAAPMGMASSAAEPFALGVVREDGILVPFARFDGTAWARIWAEPARRLAAPASLHETPASWFPPDGRVPDVWHLWPPTDQRAAASPFEAPTGRPVALQKVVTFAAHCLQGVGVQTDYRGPDDRQRSPETHPKPKAGLAVTAATVRIDRPIDLDPASPVAKWAADRATLSFHRAEDDHLENFDAAQRVPLEPFPIRRSTPVRWTKVVRLGTAQANQRSYYLEGEVRYSPTATMTGHVWLQVLGEREVTDAEVVLTDDDHKGATSRVPLGIVRLAERRFWVFESEGWEHEAYEIFETSDVSRAPAIVLEVPAGGC